jgi:hypothetical protein
MFERHRRKVPLVRKRSAGSWLTAYVGPVLLNVRSSHEAVWWVTRLFETACGGRLCPVGETVMSNFPISGSRDVFGLAPAKYNK